MRHLTLFLLHYCNFFVVPGETEKEGLIRKLMRHLAPSTKGYACSFFLFISFFGAFHQKACIAKFLVSLIVGLFCVYSRVLFFFFLIFYFFVSSV